MEKRLGLSQELLGELERLSEWHNGALDWEYPPDPSPWTEAQFDEFDRAARVVLERVRAELGPEFDITYAEVGERPQLVPDGGGIAESSG